MVPTTGTPHCVSDRREGAIYVSVASNENTFVANGHQIVERFVETLRVQICGLVYMTHTAISLTITSSQLRANESVMPESLLQEACEAVGVGRGGGNTGREPLGCNSRQGGRGGGGHPRAVGCDPRGCWRVRQMGRHPHPRP